MKRFVAIVFSVCVAASASAADLSFADQSFPSNPDPNLTPGMLCHSGKTFRYPERILYCERSVGSGLKKEVIRNYDTALGFSIEKMDRSKFKIDHLIPLCAGGSNDDENLWPQHEKVYKITDPLEPLVCDKMAKGKLLQAKAIDLVRRAKADLSEAPKVIEYVRSL